MHQSATLAPKVAVLSNATQNYKQDAYLCLPYTVLDLKVTIFKDQSAVKMLVKKIQLPLYQCTYVLTSLMYMSAFLENTHKPELSM